MVKGAETSLAATNSLAAKISQKVAASDQIEGQKKVKNDAFSEPIWQQVDV
jgi:hypothetical protein